MRPILSTFPRCSTGRLAHSHRAAIGCPGLTHNQHPVPLGRHLPICPPPAPGTRPPGLSVGEVGFFSMLCARDGMVLVVSGLPHSARCPPRAHGQPSSPSGDRVSQSRRPAQLYRCGCRCDRRISHRLAGSRREGRQEDGAGDKGPSSRAVWRARVPGSSEGLHSCLECGI